MGLQPEKGSPSKPEMQLHIGLWLTALHCALKPHEPTQGSLHLLLTQAKLNGQSWSMEHSGRQFGGAPYIPGRQEHTARSPTALHSALAPHGEGTQGAGRTGVFAARKKFVKKYCNRAK